MSRLHGRPRYADVVGTLALLVAMSGTAYAAHALPKNSVGSKQIKDDKVTSKDVRNGDIAGVDLAAGSVGNANLQPASVGGPNLRPGSVGTTNLAAGAVTGAQLAEDSVGLENVAEGAIDSASVQDKSLTLGDLVGADSSGTVTFSLNGNACTSLNLTATGAETGQVALVGLIGNVSIPNVSMTPGRVAVADQVAVRVCNQSSSTTNVSNLGVRVITFG